MRLSTIFVVLCAFSAMSAVHATTISVTSEGTIALHGGIDGLGTFGTSGSDLSGLHYSMTIRFDDSLTPIYSGEDANGSAYLAAAGPVSTEITATVNGVTFSNWVVSSVYSRIGLSYSDYPELESYTWGNTTSGQYVNADQYGNGWCDGPTMDLNSYNVCVLPAWLYTDPTFNLDARAVFDLTSTSGDSTDFVGVPSLVWSNAAPIPEPSSAALIGVAGLILLSERRRQQRGRDHRCRLHFSFGNRYRRLQNFKNHSPWKVEH